MSIPSERIYCLAFMALYFLIAYLFAMRKDGQRKLPWIILIVIQTASLFFIKDIGKWIKQLPLPAELSSEPQVTALALAGWLVFNLILIFLVNLLFNRAGKKTGNRKKSKSDADAQPEMQTQDGSAG